MYFTINVDKKNIDIKNSISVQDIIKLIYPNSSNEYIAGIVNKKLVNKDFIIESNSEIKLISNLDNNLIKLIANIYSYILGYVINKIIPKSNLINYGYQCDKNIFYYDLYFKDILNKEIIISIENYMREILKKDLTFIKKNISFKELKKTFIEKNERYKIFNITNKNENYNICIFNNYIDFLSIDFNILRSYLSFSLSKKITNVWYGNKINKVVQRIYGYIECFNKNISNFPIKDHRLLNNILDLYYISEDCPGMIFWKKNGLIIFNELKDFINNKLKNFNYKNVITPILMNKNIWIKTNHIKYYDNNIFKLNIENKNFCIKPMNCPGHILLYNQKIRSYKDLPYRISEIGNCSRNEPSGSLHGLMRTKSFFQDDGHIFCLKDQINEEINNCIDNIYEIYSILGFYSIKVKLSTRPKDRIGDENLWNFSEKIIKYILNKKCISFEFNHGEGAFYGPKIEFIILDSSNREWQCGTIQLDFFLPFKLNVKYIDKENNKQTPILIHRAILGSIERFIGIITEEYNGNYPIWLSPVQIILININKDNINYINSITKKIENYNIRYKLDIKNEKVEYKIRKYSILKVPYIFICGNKEMKSNTVNIRTCLGKNLGIFKINVILKKIKDDILNKNIY